MARGGDFEDLAFLYAGAKLEPACDLETFPLNLVRRGLSEYVYGIVRHRARTIQVSASAETILSEVKFCQCSDSVVRASLKFNSQHSQPKSRITSNLQDMIYFRSLSLNSHLSCIDARLVCYILCPQRYRVS